VDALEVVAEGDVELLENVQVWPMEQVIAAGPR
jgi:hypothetical protein